MSPVSYQLAYFLGIIFQTFLVGLFVPLLIAASYAQWNKVSKGQKINAVMAFTIVFFGLAIPAHWILGLRRVLVAALYLPAGQTLEQYFEPPYPADELVRWGIFQFLLVVGDFVMIHRLYHIYSKSLRVCIIPLITTTGLIAIGFGLTYQLGNLNSPAETKASNGWTIACFCVSLFNNGSMSAAISYRLWRVHRATVAAGASVNSESIVLRAMRVLVESAGLWMTLVLMNFFAFLAGSNLSYTFLDMTCPAVGISFCLIIVRLGSIAPEVRVDSWESFQRSGSSRIASDSRHSRLPVALDRVKVERDVYVSASESGDIEFHMMSSVPPHEKQTPIH
ncbi:hypothetical protein BJ322DRAFT_1113616 [Thelephora terrestris]|uniref:Uncharacterized protein n=1 Tax=Thelephora terrestris TaxID=56493 RepID=A0A9P6H6P1_9AGAM|nr:hypothetical protein BJ322DRAFT_1113616 [Thelephora terrestris]